MPGAAPRGSPFERELALILEGEGLGYVVRAGGSLGVDLVLILTNTGGVNWGSSVHNAVPIECKASKEDELYLSNSKDVKAQYDAFEAWHKRTGLSPVYAYRKKRTRFPTPSDAWRFFSWPRRQADGGYPILRWAEGFTMAMWPAARAFREGAT